MRYKKFVIENFKGIKKIEFNLSKNPISNVVTLVGLNESGKTTILDAISYFYEKVNPDSQSELHTTGIQDSHDLIPKDQRDSFYGDVKITAHIDLDDSDYKSLDSLLEAKGYKILSNVNMEINYSVVWSFENSESKKFSRIIGNFGFESRKGKSKKTFKNDPSNEDLWEITSVWLRNRLPPIIYYPNFLFEFPDRIYLEPFEGETKSQKYYRQFLQDVLKSINPNFTIDTYLLQRAKSVKSQDRETLNEAISKISKKITDLITSENLTVLDIYTKNKEIILTNPEIDSERNVYKIDFKLKDGTSYYWIRERSLGYKWFLTFLLLTQFRITRHIDQSPIFVFDEPASNLHQTAQQRLVNALKQLVGSSKAQVIYATHSHHLINPDWLENTFIAKNLALDYSDDQLFDAKQTSISLTRYREFVANNPNQTNYFQIILDVLEYRPSNLENIPDVIMVEGKNDGYTLSYVQNLIYSTKKVNVLPGGGSSTLDPLIRLYYAWGRNYIILLDDDKEGRKQKARYISAFGKQVEGRIFTLKDVDVLWDGFETEDLFSNTERVSIQIETDKNLVSYSKDAFNRSIQELLINFKSFDLSKETVQKFDKLINFCQEKLKTSL